MAGKPISPEGPQGFRAKIETLDGALVDLFVWEPNPDKVQNLLEDSCFPKNRFNIDLSALPAEITPLSDLDAASQQNIGNAVIWLVGYKR